jgi:hypothetical protein
MSLTLVSAPGSWLVDVPLSKYELLVSIDDAFAALARELRGTRARATDAPVPQRGWSVADHVAHLAGWDALELARVEGRVGASEILALRLHALRRMMRRGAHPGAAWSRLEEAHNGLVRALWNLPEAALRRPWHPGRSYTLAAELATNTVEHYREHLAACRDLVGVPRSYLW